MVLGGSSLALLKEHASKQNVIWSQCYCLALLVFYPSIMNLSYCFLCYLMSRFVVVRILSSMVFGVRLCHSWGCSSVPTNITVGIPEWARRTMNIAWYENLGLVAEPWKLNLNMQGLPVQDARFSQQCSWGVKSAGMWCCASGLVSPDILIFLWNAGKQ